MQRHYYLSPKQTQLSLSIHHAHRHKLDKIYKLGIISYSMDNNDHIYIICIYVDTIYEDTPLDGLPDVIYLWQNIILYISGI